MPNYLKKLDHIMDILERNITGYATLAVAIIMFINVVLRNFFHSGLVWGNEISSYLNILTVFVAASAGFKSGAHVGVSVVVDFVVPKNLHKTAALITNLCVLAFLGLVTFLGVRMAAKQFIQHQLSPVLNVPIGALYVIAAVGMAASFIRVVMEIIKLYYPESPASGDSGKEGN